MIRACTADRIGKALVRAVSHQQLSDKAAAAIHGRVMGLYTTPDPACILETSDEEMEWLQPDRRYLEFLK